MELLIAAVSIVLVTDSQVRDAMGLIDVPERGNGDGDAPQLLDELHPFPNCQMLMLDEELLAGDALDLRCTQPPATKFWLVLLERDRFYYTSSIMLAGELPNGALWAMYQEGNLANRELLLAEFQDFLLSDCQHSLEDSGLLGFQGSSCCYFGLRL